MSGRLFQRSRRQASEVAIQLLFANNSDDEEQDVDDEDLDFVVEDIEAGADETIIFENVGEVDDEDTDEEADEEIMNDNPNRMWSKRNNLRPPNCHFNEPEIDYDDIPDEAGDCYLYVSQLDHLIEAIIIPQSIIYAQQNGKSFTITPDEIKAFLAIMIFMGYHKLPAMRDYWSSDSDMGIEFVQKLMPRQRFEEILRNLHFTDNENANLEDRAYKIRSIINHFNESFQKRLPPTRNQSIDEHMVTFKGHSVMKQYMPKKPIKWGFKFWMRSDAKSGYCYELDLYTGRKPEGSEYGLGETTILDLSQKINHLGVRLAFDNFFSSVRLMEKLHDNGILSVATVRCNAKNLPPIAKHAKKMKKGEIQGSVSDDGRVSYCQWMDKRAVTLLSNFLCPEQTTMVKRRVKGSRSKQEVEKPIMVSWVLFFRKVS